MLNTIKRIIKLSGSKSKRLYIGFVYVFINSIFCAMPIMGAAYALKLVNDHINGHIQINLNHVLICIGIMIFAVAGRCLFSYLIASRQESIGYEVMAEERLKIGNTLKRVPMGFYGDKDIGEITSAVTTDISLIENTAIKFISVAVNGYVNIIATALCLMIFNVGIGFISIEGAAVATIFLNCISKKSRKNAEIRHKSQNAMVSAVLQYIRGLSVVKAFKQEGIIKDSIRNSLENSRKINTKIEVDFSPLNGLTKLSLNIASVGMIALAGILAVKGSMPVYIMIMMVTFSFVIYNSLGEVGDSAHMMRLIDSALDNIEAIKNAEFIDNDSKDISLTDYNIKFDDVTFAYDNKNVLEHVSFEIPQNTTAAIIGPSGSGKTTICNLLARFYDIQQGHISIGGVDIKNIKCDSLLRNISMVFQKVYLFNDTILNNIRFGNPDATMEEVEEAAKKACCHDFIMNLSNGYDTVVGEGGNTLSGGQKQRISIARAILKNAPIVILDEATASIDPENESLIQQAIDSLVHGKTIIIIAHRLATIQNADQILVVNNKKIVQQGNHDKLIKEEGIYKNYLKIRENAERWSIA